MVWAELELGHVGFLIGTPNVELVCELGTVSGFDVRRVEALTPTPRRSSSWPAWGPFIGGGSEGFDVVRGICAVGGDN